MLPPRASQAAHFERNGVIIIWGDGTLKIDFDRGDQHRRFGVRVESKGPEECH